MKGNIHSTRPRELEQASAPLISAFLILPFLDLSNPKPFLNQTFRLYHSFGLHLRISVIILLSQPLYTNKILVRFVRRYYT